MLLVLASAAILATGQLHPTVREVQVISQGTLAAAVAGLAGMGVLAAASAFEGDWRRWLGRLPLVVSAAEKLLAAVVAYRHKPGVLAVSCLLSLAIHRCCTLSVYWIALGLPGDAPSRGDHFVIVPLALVTGVLPLPVNGLGAMEYAVDALYQWIPASGALPEGRGFVVALGYRAATILAAVIAAAYYLASRREVAQVFEAAELDMAQSRTPGPAKIPSCLAGVRRRKIAVPVLPDFAKHAVGDSNPCRTAKRLAASGGGIGHRARAVGVKTPLSHGDSAVDRGPLGEEFEAIERNPGVFDVAANGGAPSQQSPVRVQYTVLGGQLLKAFQSASAPDFVVPEPDEGLHVWAVQDCAGRFGPRFCQQTF